MVTRRFMALFFAAATVVSLGVARPASASLFGDRRPDEFAAEQYMFSLINNKRHHATTPKPVLTLDRQMRLDARDNSDSMAADDQFESPSTFASSPCATVGHGRANTGYTQQMNSIFSGWLSNPTTRRCILDPTKHFGAVGVTRGDNWSYWVTFIASPRADTG